MKLVLALAVASFLTPSPLPASQPLSTDRMLLACRGCGCRGGPGWRIHRTGQCAGKTNLAKECGRPPSPSLCTKEN